VGGIFKNFWIGGNDDINIWISLLILAVFSLVIYYLAVYSRLPESQVDEYIKDVYPAPAPVH
jgi:hypothetical protein